MGERTEPGRLAADLARLLRTRTGASVAVEGLTRLSGGASRETWAFDAAGEDGRRRPLVLQRERGGVGTTSRGMGVQASLIEAADAAGVPVPEMVALDEDGSVMGAPSLVTARVEGETIARRILRDPEYRAVRGRLVADVGAALAAVHRIDPTEVPGLSAADELQQLSDLSDLLGEPHPAFELGLARLRETRPAPRPPRVVHGDLRMGNLVVGPDGLRALLDWELAHLGDPVEDLGWFCVPAWRFGSDMEAGGVGTVAHLLDSYHRAGGAAVSEEELRWWTAFGTLRWGLICVLQAATHLGGVSRSVELAAIGRRVAENEEDLLTLLVGASDYEPPEATTPSAEQRSAPHDRPTAAELLDAVGEYLVEVRDEVPGRLGFHARVAANVVAIVGREMELGPTLRSAHADRLARLGVADDAELCAALRSGAMDDRLHEVTESVRASVRDKLAVANPGYWRRP